MRPVGTGSRYLAREPDYDRAAEDARIAERLADAAQGDFTAARADAAAKRRTIRWCTSCVYPSITAAPMEFDEQRRVHRLPDGGGEGRDRAGRMDAPPRAAARDLSSATAAATAAATTSSSR